MTSITLGWTVVNATSWDIQYGAPGSALGATANTTITSTTNPKVTGLTSGNSTSSGFVKFVVLQIAWVDRSTSPLRTVRQSPLRGTKILIRQLGQREVVFTM